MAGHSHSHSHHHHGHQTAHAHPETVSRAGGALRAAAAITLLFALVEGVGGWWTGSLALLSDAGHMLTDAAALGFGAVAAWMARRPPSGRHSYGLGRAEILAAFANSGVMLVIVGALAYESLIRLRVPAEVNGEVASLIALGGLGNYPGAWLAAELLGLTEVFTQYYLGSNAASAVVYVVFIGVLVFRPQGLLGRVSRV